MQQQLQLHTCILGIHLHMVQTTNLAAAVSTGVLTNYVVSADSKGGQV